jgi:hypothetical protein
MFELNDRSGSPPIKRTMGKLSRLFKRNYSRSIIQSTVPGRPSIRKIILPLRLMTTPLIIQSRIGKVAYPAPYFEGRNVDFFSDFEKMKEENTNFMFFIIANNFVERNKTTQSHMLMGLYLKDGRDKLYIIDPNGNDVSLNNIYSGDEFKRLSQGVPLRNPLYNTIGKIMRYYTAGQNFDIKFYTGDPIICPRGSPKNCTYRTIMIMLGLVNSPGLNLENAIAQANFMAEHKLSQVKTILNKVFNNDANTNEYFKSFFDGINKKLLRIDFYNI